MGDPRCGHSCISTACICRWDGTITLWTAPGTPAVILHYHNTGTVLGLKLVYTNRIAQSSRWVINVEVSVLVRCIQTPQYQEMLGSEMFVTRRSICSLLLEPSSGLRIVWTSTYSETRNLFAQMLAEMHTRNSLCCSRRANSSDRRGIPGQH